MIRSSERTIYFAGQPPITETTYQTNLVFACKWFTLARAGGHDSSAELSETSLNAGQIMASRFQRVPPAPLVIAQNRIQPPKLQFSTATASKTNVIR